MIQHINIRILTFSQAMVKATTRTLFEGNHVKRTIKMISWTSCNTVDALTSQLTFDVEISGEHVLTERSIKMLFSPRNWTSNYGESFKRRKTDHSEVSCGYSWP